MKTKKNKLNFTKCQILNLDELTKIIGGVGGGDDDNRTRTLTTSSASTRNCHPND